MRVERGGGWRWWLNAAAMSLILWPGLPLAAESEAVTMSLTLNAGESYVIDHVKVGATPGVKVVKNPGALLVHNEEPGKVTLMGAEPGEWKLTVKMADGSKIIYDVTVKKIANPYAISSPAAYSSVVSGGAKPSGIVTAPVAKLKKTAGPAAPPVSPTPPPAVSALGGTRMVTVPETSAPESAMAAPAQAPSRAAAPVNAAPAAKAVSLAPPPAPAVPPSQAAPAAIAEKPLKYMTNPAIAITGGVYASPAVNGGPNYLPADVVMIQSGTSRIIDFVNRIRRISIADTHIADLQVINPFEINLIGHKPGFTTLAVWDKQGHYEERSVRVDPDSRQQVLLNTMVAELNRSAIETQGTNLAFALTKWGVSLSDVTGAIASPYSPSISLSGSSSSIFGTTTSGPVLNPPGTLTPLVFSSNPNYLLAAGNQYTQINGFFQYLETHNLAKILAQPHLLANSGEEAKFLDGGEIPIVIAQALNTSIVFKQFGTSVEFVPTVVGRSDIELLVKPELSEPDFAHGVTEFGFTIPAFVTRRAETMVRLKDNQTLVIAGLLQHNKITSINKVPYLGDIPYVGGMFRTTSYTNSESELVISVTPQIIRPLSAAAQVYNPTTMPEMTRSQVETKRLPQPDITRPRF